MTHFRTRLFKYPPTWNEGTRLGEFDFESAALRAVFRREIELFESHPALEKYPARVKQNAKFKALETEFLEWEIAAEPLLIWPDERHGELWYLLDQLALNGAWKQVRCFECAAVCEFAACRIEKWSIGGGLAAEGGRLLLCESGHLLCRSREWIS